MSADTITCTGKKRERERGKIPQHVSQLFGKNSGAATSHLRFHPFSDVSTA